jgi:hypothetical protein
MKMSLNKEKKYKRLTNNTFYFIKLTFLNKFIREQI